MYEIKIHNKNLNKIFDKYKNNSLNNFIIISKIKKYNRTKKKFNKYKTNYENTLKNDILKLDSNIQILNNIITKEKKISSSFLLTLNKLKTVKLNKKLTNKIQLLSYDKKTKYKTKIFISELYRLHFFKKTFSIEEINNYKVKYNNYILEKIKKINNFKKDNHNKIKINKKEIKDIKDKIKEIRNIKYELYKKNNLIDKNLIIEYNKNYSFDNKEIYLLKENITKIKNNILEIENKKILDNKNNNKFELINLENNKIILPIIKNDNELLLNYNLKNIFINKINSEIINSNKIINDKINILEKIINIKNNKKQLLEYKLIDNKIKYYFDSIQNELYDIEKTIIKDYLFLNKKLKI